MHTTARLENISLLSNCTSISMLFDVFDRKSDVIIIKDIEGDGYVFGDDLVTHYTDDFVHGLVINWPFSVVKTMTDLQIQMLFMSSNQLAYY